MVDVVFAVHFFLSNYTITYITHFQWCVFTVGGFFFSFFHSLAWFDFVAICERLMTSFGHNLSHAYIWIYCISNIITYKIMKNLSLTMIDPTLLPIHLFLSIFFCFYFSFFNKNFHALCVCVSAISNTPANTPCN